MILICKTISHTNKLISSITEKWDDMDLFFHTENRSKGTKEELEEGYSITHKKILAPVSIS